MPYYPPSSGGTTTTGSNIGTGEGLVFATVSGSDLQFRRILAGVNVQVTTTGNDITISGPAGSGEANTASNVGTGAGQIYKSKTLVNLDLRNIAGDLNINVTTGTNDITLGLTTSVTMISARFTASSAAPTPPSGQADIYFTSGGFGFVDNSAQSYQFLDGWRGVLTTSTISSSITYASTGLISATLPVGYYQFTVVGAFQSNTTTCGVGYRLNQGNGTISEILAEWRLRQAADGVDSFFDYSQLATSTNVVSASVIAAATKYPFNGTGWFRLSARGTVVLEHRSEVASPSQITTSTGTCLVITRVG